MGLGQLNLFFLMQMQNGVRKVGTHTQFSESVGSQVVCLMFPCLCTVGIYSGMDAGGEKTEKKNVW